MDKNYEPEVVSENPFPNEVLQTQSAPTQGNSGNYTPTTTKEKTFPKKRSAVELLSTALNTKSRKILQEFELQQSGGLQIGNFEDGVSGDVRLTPNGITGRDNAGITRFGIDTDGNAIFAGEIRAGSTIVNDNIITEGASSGNGRTVYYNNGLPAIVIGDPD